MAAKKQIRPRLSQALWRDILRWCEEHGYTIEGGLRVMLTAMKEGLK